MRRTNAVAWTTPLLSLCLLACTGDKDPNVDTGGLTGGDGADGTATIDQDADGFDATEDCDDDNDLVYPGAEELCDGLDNDCDDETDEGVLLSFFADVDEDGFGDADVEQQGCAAPSGFVDNADDCDDAEAAAYPGATEKCDGIDNDCNGSVDGDIDLDGDGWFDADCGGSDCNDDDSAVSPDAVEVCEDGIDNDCDGGSGECAPAGDIPLATAHAILRGEAEGDRAGQGDPGLASAGDVNGDGFGDLIVGAIRNDAGASNAGAAYILYGPIVGEDNLVNADAKIVGEAVEDYLGRGVNGVGDVNDDGFDDVIAIAFLSDRGAPDAGAAYVFHGPLSGSLPAAGADLTLLAEGAGDQLADAEYLGDTDGDGVADLLVAAQFNDTAGVNAGTAYIVLSPATGEIDLGDSAIRIDGGDLGEEFGSALGSGDFNGDGLADVLMGARFSDTSAADAGAVYLFEGPLTVDLTVTEADASFLGAAAGDQLGNFASVASGGDLDGDGSTDIVLGASENAGGGFKRGAVYVHFGPTHSVGQSVTEAGSILNGELNSDKTGDSIDGLGDFDGDGFDDLIVGSGFADAGTVNGGAAYLLLGPLAPGTSSLVDANARYTAEADNDRVRVQSAGDVNADGRADLFVGAQNNSVVGNQAGAVYLFLGAGL